jgi:LMBR1 domain-containing protein 1
VVYAVAVVLVAAVASTFIYIYQSPRERAPSVTIVSIITLTALLATVLLLPVDVALVSSTTSSKLGQRKEWATQQKVDEILYTLKVLYYTLFSLDAILCLIVVPFTYFWHEEYDQVDAEEGNQTIGQRFWGAFKYTIAFIALVVILFLVGFFVPVAKDRKGGHYDLDFFKNLLSENHGERALTFAMGLLTTLGVLLYVLYTGAGLALLPVTFIKSAPSISAPTLNANVTSELEANRERQRQLEGRNEGREGGLSSKDQRELDALIREERTLQRRQRLAAEATGEHQGHLMKAWTKIEAVFRPLKLIGGIFILLVAIFLWVSMLITGIDKASHSICKSHCGYILGHTQIFNPVNWILVKSAKVFPIDYVLFLLLVLLFFSSSVVGIGIVGIRFLWLRIFQIRKGHTSPQAMLISTVMLTLMALAINYAIAMMLAPQYSHFGPQTYCDHPPIKAGAQPDCSDHPNHIRPCTEVPEYSSAAKNVCTPSVGSTFLNRVTVNFSFFGIVDFWAQFFFLGKSLLVPILLTLMPASRFPHCCHHVSLPDTKTRSIPARPRRRGRRRRGSPCKHRTQIWCYLAGHYRSCWQTWPGIDHGLNESKVSVGRFIFITERPRQIGTWVARNRRSGF